MSLNSSIDIKLARRNNYKICATQLINTFINNGWKVIEGGKISYLPLGDDDDYDWQSEDITIEQLNDIIENKEKSGEIIGVIMKCGDTDIGGSFLIYSELELSFSMTINRKTTKCTNNHILTDVNWYVERIVCLLRDSDYIIESFSYEEY